MPTSRHNNPHFRNTGELQSVSSMPNLRDGLLREEHLIQTRQHLKEVADILFEGSASLDDGNSVTEVSSRRSTTLHKTGAVVSWYLFNVIVVYALLIGITDGEITIPIKSLFNLLDGRNQTNNPNRIPAVCCSNSFVAPGDAPVRGFFSFENFEFENFEFGQFLVQMFMLVAAIAESFYIKFRSPLMIYSSFKNNIEDQFGEFCLSLVHFFSLCSMIVRGCFIESGGNPAPAFAIAIWMQLFVFIFAYLKSNLFQSAISSSAATPVLRT